MRTSRGFCALCQKKPVGRSLLAGRHAAGLGELRQDDPDLGSRHQAPPGTARAHSTGHPGCMARWRPPRDRISGRHAPPVDGAQPRATVARRHRRTAEFGHHGAHRSRSPGIRTSTIARHLSGPCRCRLPPRRHHACASARARSHHRADALAEMMTNRGELASTRGRQAAHRLLTFAAGLGDRNGPLSTSVPATRPAVMLRPGVSLE